MVLSTEPETILTLADRVLIMRKGAVTAAFSQGRIDKSDLLAAA
jgi:ribose transport system ATP-binding protein